MPSSRPRDERGHASRGQPAAHYLGDILGVLGGEPRAARLRRWHGRCSIMTFRSDVRPAMCPFPYIYRWDRCGRKGQRCRVFARGTMNSVGLAFEDGFTMVTSGNALRRCKEVA